MDSSHILTESELEAHTSLFNFPLKAAEDEFVRTLRSPLRSNRRVILEQQREILLLRNHKETLREIESELQSVVADESLLRSHKPTESTKVAEGQIFFQGETTKVLNTVPQLLAICVFLKIQIAPILALMTPLILFCMPYIILTGVMDMSLTWDQQIVMMKHMTLGLSQGEAWKPKHQGQALWTGVSLLQSMVTPFLTAQHTSKLDTTITERGNALIRCSQVAQKALTQLQGLGAFQGAQYSLPEIPIEPREAAAWMDQEPLGLQWLQRCLGRISIVTRIALDETWHSVEFHCLDTAAPLKLSDVCDLAVIQKSTCVTSDLLLSGHSLITGPNRGGKSSVLRGVLQTILLGQQFGFTYHAKGSWKPFSTLFTRLKSRDTAGKESLFEMEVRHASQILHHLKKDTHSSLVLIDELFHSTNPPDAETSARTFLQKLWKLPHCKSMISTHIFALCEESSTIQKLCCSAIELPSGPIQYSQKLTPGVCRVSSVREVLTEAGMCA